MHLPASFRRLAGRVIAPAAVAGSGVIGDVLSRAHGWAQVLEIAAIAVLTLAAGVVQNLAAGPPRLDIALEVEQPSEIPVLTSYSTVSNLWRERERSRCYPSQPARPLRAAGLTEQQTQPSLAGAHSAVGADMARMLGKLQEPDTRSRADYDQEVETYLTGGEQELGAWMLHFLATSGRGVIRLTVVNKSELPMHDLQIRVLGHDVIMQELDDVAEPQSMSARPRPFGRPKPRLASMLSSSKPVRAPHPPDARSTAA